MAGRHKDTALLPELFLTFADPIPHIQTQIQSLKLTLIYTQFCQFSISYAYLALAHLGRIALPNV
jgi:hypothetical protein